MSGWTQEEDDRLHRLWMQTAPVLSTAAIAAVMGRSKNSIVGRAHRTNLAARPSPIVRRGEGRPAARPRVGVKRTLMAIPGVGASAEPMIARPAPPPAPLPRAKVMPGTASYRGCRYPMWGHQERPGLNPLFCEEPTRASEAGGGPYCPEHAAKCFTVSHTSGFRAPTLRGVSASSLSVTVRRESGDPEPLTGEAA